MAILTRQLFSNPYIALGNDRDICAMCRTEYLQEHQDEYSYVVDQELQGKLRDKKVFKLFKNSNTPFVLCDKHVKEILNEILEEDV